MKALIIDPALRSQGGHHHNAVLRLQEELAKLGVRTSCLSSAYAETQVVQSLGCTPCFTRSLYGRSYAAADEFASNVEVTIRELAQALSPWGALADLLVLPCCDQVLAAALARQLTRCRLAPRPHILLWLLYAPHYKRPPDDPIALGLHAEYRDAFAELRAVAGSDRRLQAYSETPAMAAFYRNLLEFDIQVVPAPGLIRPRLLQRPDRPPTIVCIGFANRPKGYRLLPQAVINVLQRHRDVHFLIHGIVEGSDAQDERWAFDRLSSLGERVIVRDGVLSQEEYEDCLAKADLLLLPYDPEVYGIRGSGVFTEARAIGIPVVATQGCAFAQPAFDGGWGIPITHYSSQGVADAILKALDHSDELAARAAHAAFEVADELPAMLRATVDAIRADGSSGLRGKVGRLIRKIRLSNRV